jgi:hypothetical protein
VTTAIKTTQKHYRWRWVIGKGEYLKFDEVWIESDGSLHNPRGYPEDLARAAVLEADAQEYMRKSGASKRAAETRRERQEERIYQAARRIVTAMGIGQQRRCYCCRRGLTDSESIARGIGSECWQKVLDAVVQIKGGEERAS